MRFYVLVGFEDSACDIWEIHKELLFQLMLQTIMVRIVMRNVFQILRKAKSVGYDLNP